MKQGLTEEVFSVSMPIVLRGKPAQKQRLLVGGEQVSSIAIIHVSVSGLLDVSVVKGTVDGD